MASQMNMVCAGHTVFNAFKLNKYKERNNLVKWIQKQSQWSFAEKIISLLIYCNDPKVSDR